MRTFLLSFSVLVSLLLVAGAMKISKWQVRHNERIQNRIRTGDLRYTLWQPHGQSNRFFVVTNNLIRAGFNQVVVRQTYSSNDLITAFSAYPIREGTEVALFWGEYEAGAGAGKLQLPIVELFLPPIPPVTEK